LAAGETLRAPNLTDVEVLQVLRRYSITKVFGVERANEALQDYTAMSLNCYPHAVLLPRVWELRHNLTAYLSSASFSRSEFLILSSAATRSVTSRRIDRVHVPILHAHLGNGSLRGKFRTILAAAQDLATFAHAAGRHGRFRKILEMPGMYLNQAGGQQDIQELTGNLLRRIAEDTLRALIEQYDPLFVIYLDNGIVGKIENFCEWVG
jgi:hypothetical protein